MRGAISHREVLGDVIASADRPMTPREVFAVAKKTIPSLGIATVYRAIRQFVREGQVRQIEIQGAPPHYENAGKNHHHFFFCVHCGRLFDAPGCVRGLSGLAPSGFQVRRHEIVLYGDCAACRARN